MGLAAHAAVYLMRLRSQGKCHVSGGITVDTVMFTCGLDCTASLRVASDTVSSGGNGSADIAAMGRVLLEVVLAAACRNGVGVGGGIPDSAAASAGGSRAGGVHGGSSDSGVGFVLGVPSFSDPDLEAWRTLLASLTSCDAGERMHGLSCIQWSPVFAGSQFARALALADISPPAAQLQLSKLPLPNAHDLFTKGV